MAETRGLSEKAQMRLAKNKIRLEEQQKQGNGEMAKWLEKEGPKKNGKIVHAWFPRPTHGSEEVAGITDDEAKKLLQIPPVNHEKPVGPGKPRVRLPGRNFYQKWKAKSFR